MIRVSSPKGLSHSPSCISWLGLLEQTGGLHNRKLVCRGQKSESKVLTGQGPSGGRQGDRVPGPSPSVWWLVLAGISGIPWLVEASPSSLLSSSHSILSVCMSVSTFVLLKNTPIILD